MKKQFNRVLAMLLTLVTLLTVLPISTFADGWLDVEGDTTQNGNVTSTNVTVTVTAKALLSYLKSGDISSLKDGISISGLKDAISADELFEIISKESFKEIIDTVKDDIDPQMLLQYISTEELLEMADIDGLIELVKGLENLQDYIKDGGYDILMDKYITIEEILEIADVDGIIELIKGLDDLESYIKDSGYDILMDKYITLTEILDIADIDGIISLIQELDNLEDYIKDGGYDILMDKYISFKELLDIADIDGIIGLIKELQNLEDYIKDGGYDILMDKYITLKELLDIADIDGIIGLIEGLEGFESYIKETGYDVLFDKGYITGADIEDALKNSSINIVDFIDIDKFAQEKASVLVDLALNLSTDDLLKIVDVDAVMELDGIDFGTLINAAYFKETIGYENLFDNFVDQNALATYIQSMIDAGKWDADVLHSYVYGNKLADLFASKDGAAIAHYVDMANLQAYLATPTLKSEYTYSNLKAKNILSETLLIAKLRSGGYAALEQYLDKTVAEEILKEEFPASELANSAYWDGTTLKLDILFNDKINEINFEDLISRGAIKTDEMLFATGSNAPYSITTLINENIIDLTKLIKSDLPGLDVVSLENNHVIHYQELIFGKGGAEPLFTAHDLVVLDALNLSGMLNGIPAAGANPAAPALFTIQELYQHSVIDMDKLLTQHKYKDMTDISALEGKLKELIDNKTLSADDVLNCLIKDSTTGDPDYKKAIEVIKIDTITEKITYQEILNTYVPDFKALFTALKSNLDIKAILNKIIDGDDLETIFDTEGLIDAIGTDKIFNYIDVQKAVENLYQDIIDNDDLETIFNTDALVDAIGIDKIFNYIDVKTAFNNLYQDIIDNDDLENIFKTDALIDAIGVDKIFQYIDMSAPAINDMYQEIIDGGDLENIFDTQGLIDAIGIDELFKYVDTQAVINDLYPKIMDNGDLENIFDVQGLITAIGTDKLLEFIDVKAIITKLYNEGALTEILKSLNPDKYLACLNKIYNSFMSRLRSLTINGVTVTESNLGMILIKPEKLMQAVKEMIPTFEDLKNINDDATVLSFSISMTYISATTGKENTKAISGKVNLAGAADEIRTLATKLDALLDKFISYSYNNGVLTVDVALPTAFASAIRFVLENLGSDADPELVKLKDELLDLYGANISDTANFINNITLEQLTALLDKVDGETFKAAFDKVMQIRYVELALDVIGNATGYDLSGIDLNDLIAKMSDLPTIPTFDAIAAKVESITGYDILSKLPAKLEGIWSTVGGKTVTEILDAIAAKAGLDVDTKAILDQAIASGDPITYLYDYFTGAVENSAGLYNAAKNKFMYAVNLLLSSDIGSKLNTLKLGDFYDGNSVFGIEKGLTVNLYNLIDRGLSKVISVISSRVDLDQDLIDGIESVLLGMFSRESELSVKFDLSLKVSDLFLAEFYDENGKLIDKYFLPAGTSLALTQGDYTPIDPEKTFIGWRDATGAFYTEMPAKDVAFRPGFEGEVVEYYDVTVIDPYDNNKVVGIYSVEAGSTLLDVVSAETLNALFASATGKNLVPAWYRVDENNAFGKNDAYALTTPVTADTTIAWKYYTLTVYAADGTEKGKMEIGANTTITSINTQLLTYTDAVEKGLIPAWYLFADGQRGAHVNNDAAVTWDMDLTWHYPTITVTVWKENIGAASTPVVTEDHITVSYGTNLQDWIAARDNNEKYSIAANVDAHLLALHAYHKEWDYKGVTLVTDDVNVELHFAPDTDSLKLGIDGSKYGEDYTIGFQNGHFVVTWKNNLWTDTMDLFISSEIVTYCVNGSYGITLQSEVSKTDGSKYSIALNSALLTALSAKMIAGNVDEVDLSYKRGEYTDGKKTFTLGFVSTSEEINEGDFFKDGEGLVTIVYPYKSFNTTDKKTALYIDGEKGVLIDTAIPNTVVFTTKHFSEFVIVDEYRLSYADNVAWDMTNAAALKLPTLATDAVFTALPIAEGFYAPGTVITIGASTFATAYSDGMFHSYLAANGSKLTGTSYTMPAKAVTLTQNVKANVYHIYYYVYGTDGYAVVDVYDYTKWTTDLRTWDKLLAPTIQGVDTTGYVWVGGDSTKNLAQTPGNYYLFLVKESVATEKFTLKFSFNGQIVYTSNAFTVTEWIAEHLATVVGLANATLPNEEASMVVWTLDGKAFSEITMEEWAEIFADSTSNEITLIGEIKDREYTVSADANVIDLSHNKAPAGTDITFKVSEKLGMNVVVKLIAGGLETVLTPNGEGVYTFKMGQSDVSITVEYTKKTYSYVDVDGTVRNDVAYGTEIFYALVIPNNYWIDSDKLTAAIAEFGPAGLTLVSAKANDEGNLVFTYSFLMNETNNGINLQAFDEQARKYVNEIEYLTVYVVNGKYYATEAEALAACPEGVTVKWEVGAYKNMFIAAFETEEDDGIAGLIWLIVLLVLLILILVIVIFYVLYICGKLKPNWFLKVITAIVSAFFAVCMAIAAGALAIARLFGYKEEDIMEETVEIPSNAESIETEIVPEAEVAEETSEEAADATEEAEIVAPVTEDVEITETEGETEANQSAESTDAVEVEVEELAEEISEETSVEATEELEAEVEAAVAEAMEEVIADEAPAAEAVEEVSEEAAEEATEEEISEEATEEATEEDASEEKKNQTNE